MSAVWVDLVLAAFLGHAIWRGWQRGLVRGIAKILGLIVASVAAALLHAPIGALLGSVGVPDRFEDLAGALLVFAGVIIGFRFVGNSMAKALRFTKVGRLVDGGAGSALSGIWALSLSALVLMSVSLFEGSAAADAVAESSLGSSIVETAPEVASAVADADVRRWIFQILKPPDQEEPRKGRAAGVSR